jgi:cytochrome c oxidase assembly protein subunit 15
MIFGLFLWARGRGDQLQRRPRLILNLICVMALVQPGLGIATLILVVPVSLAAAHQAGAMILLGLLIWLLNEIRLADRDYR